MTDLEIAKKAIKKDILEIAKEFLNYR